MDLPEESFFSGERRRGGGLTCASLQTLNTMVGAMFDK